MRTRRLLALLAAGAVAALAAGGAAPATADDRQDVPLRRAAYATIEGTGSTWSELIVKQWIADVDANGIKVVYTGGGSSKGRKDFSQNTTDFAISEIPYQGTDETGQSDTSNGRDFAYLPVVAGGTAFTYQLKVGDTLVKNLRLSGETIAEIFTGRITNWNDPQITADNNGRTFPDKTIVPVVRSDGSGTTAQFTTWLDQAYPSIWRPYFGTSGLTSYFPKKGDTMIAQAGSDQVMNTVAGFAGDGTIGYVEYSYPLDKGYPVVKVLNKAYPATWRAFFGKSGLTSYYPRKGRAVGQAGSDQVMNTIAGFAGNGTIGYVEYSYPLDKGYPVVKVLNKAGYYVEPTQYNTAVALTRAKINTNKSDPSRYLTQILDGVYTNPDKRAYPISSYSYMIIPTGADDPRMTTAKRQSLADFLYYSLCGGQTKAGPYGYSPLPLNLVTAGFQQIANLKKADPAVDLTDRDVRTCNNPTFDGKNPSKNVLAEIAPDPPECDKVGEGPCGSDTGNNDPTGGDGTTVPGTDPGTTGPGADPAAPGGADPSPGGSTDQDTGAPGAPPGGAAPVIDPDTGQVVAGTSSSTGSEEAIFANASTLDDRPLDSATFGWVAVVELLALVLLPGLLVAVLRRRRQAGAA